MWAGVREEFRLGASAHTADEVRGCQAHEGNEQDALKDRRAQRACERAGFQATAYQQHEKRGTPDPCHQPIPAICTHGAHAHQPNRGGAREYLSARVEFCVTTWDGGPPQNRDGILRYDLYFGVCMCASKNLCACV